MATYRTLTCQHSRRLKLHTGPQAFNDVETQPQSQFSCKLSSFHRRRNPSKDAYPVEPLSPLVEEWKPAHEHLQLGEVRLRNAGQLGKASRSGEDDHLASHSFSHVTVLGHLLPPGGQTDGRTGTV